MAEKLDGQRMKSVLLAIIQENIDENVSWEEGYVLDRAAQRLEIRYNHALEQALLTVWHDLFRTGHLARGHNIDQVEGWFHVTEQGRRTLEHISRDPANPDGYLAHLRTIGMMNPIIESYLNEALQTYNTNCFKASAVMIGVAVESITLELRDALVQQILAAGNEPRRSLKAHQIKQVQTGLRGELDSRKQDMPHSLRERYEAYWDGFVQQIRISRNETGHPNSIEPITAENVHGLLLMFPAILETAVQLKAWIDNHH